MLLAETGETSRALELIQRALAQYERLGIRETRNFANAARVYKLAGEADKARTMIDAGLALARECQSPMMEAQVERALSDLPD